MRTLRHAAKEGCILTHSRWAWCRYCRPLQRSREPSVREDPPVVCCCESAEEKPAKKEPKDKEHGFEKRLR